MRNFIITGSIEKREKFIADFVVNESIKQHFITRYEDQIDIKAARELRSKFSVKQSDKRLFVLSSINLISQNTLLKSFEEMPESISVIISVDSIIGLLDTVKSRMFLVNVGFDEMMDEKLSPNLIFNTLSQRFKMIDDFLSENKEDPKKQIDKFLIIYRKSLMGNLKNLTSEDLRIHLRILKKIMNVSVLIKNNNLNVRMGLENALLS